MPSPQRVEKGAATNETARGSKFVRPEGNISLAEEVNGGSTGLGGFDENWQPLYGAQEADDVDSDLLWST